MKKAVIFVPFWRQASHIGNNRVDRFVRWLSKDGYRIIMICAGSSDNVSEKSWGQEITVSDRLGLYRDSDAGKQTAVNSRKPNKLRRKLAYWLFNPDPTIVWARSAARHPTVIAAVEGAQFIISSSPPESAHVGAWLLSRNTSIPHIVDMRDGWLDEPLKPILRTSALRRWQEGRLERGILHDAKGIQVTSDIWKDLLCERYPQLVSKVKVLTNGYPENAQDLRATKSGRDSKNVVLIHAGRFIGSALTRYPSLLLEPLLVNLAHSPNAGVIRLIGALTADEIEMIEVFKHQFAVIGWEIEIPGAIPRTELLKQLPNADGLLLLSASYAALPSKLFEYIPTGLPIFVVTEKGSATWRMCEHLPQAKLVETNMKSLGSDKNEKASFYENPSFSVPNDFSEEHQAIAFNAFLKS